MSETELSPGIKRLRKVVIIMGFVLVTGTIALFIAAFIKFSHKKPEPVNSYASISSGQNDRCDFKPTSNIEVDGNIISSNINGNILTIITGRKAKPVSVNKVQEGNSLTLTAKAPQSSQEIVVFDLCKGEVISRLTVVN